MISAKLICLLALFASLLEAAPILDTTDDYDTLEDYYIVVMKEGLTKRDWDAHKEWSDSIPAERLRRRQQEGIYEKKWTYEATSFKGYCGRFSQDVIQEIASSEHVDFIEPDIQMKASVLVAQANAPWGLSRISQRFPETGEYFFDSSAGEGTFTYVIDTGINVDHLEFEGRAIFAANFAGDGQNTDGAGHGTHVAGTVGSRAYGVAKRTKLIGIKVLGSDGSGSNGDVLAGIDYAVTHAKAEGLIGKAVANLSLGGPRSRASNRVVESAVREGMFMAVAAGNEGQSANDASPASAEGACTVGATESDDDRADFSNFGDAVDIFAPGVDIMSTYIGSNTATRKLSGTSMAAPHIAGLAAYLIAKEGPKEPIELCRRIQDLASRGNVKGTKGEKNLLAYNGNGA